MTDTPRRTVLLTGATGFVGRRTWPALVDAGFEVRCASRRPDEAARRFPDKAWVRLDVTAPDTIRPALAGCDAAIFLVHAMDSGAGYADRERAAAEAFASAAGREGLQRIVYLGGMAPAGTASDHLKSRLDTGEILRAGPVGAVELRAGMIVGDGSESWRICRDLAARLPFMVLPRWLESRSQPTAIHDVVAALVHAVDGPPTSMLCDLPGPETLSAKEILLRIAQAWGIRPRTVSVPFITPRLSSHWLRLVTGANMRIARELIEGLTEDLISQEPAYWDRMEGFCPTPFDDAVRQALLADQPESRRTRALEWTVRRISRKSSA